MGQLSFWYIWATGIRKKMINLTFKKWNIFKGWLKLAHFQHSHFLINFENSCAHLGANFLNFLSETPPAFKIVMFLKEVMQETRTICTSENGPIWGTPNKLFLRWNLSTFFLFLWIKSTKMKVRPYFAMQKVQKLLKTP